MTVRNLFKVTIHANRRLHHTLDLAFTFGAKTRDCLSFPFEVGLHNGKLLDNGFNSLAKAWAWILSSPPLLSQFLLFSLFNLPSLPLLFPSLKPFVLYIQLTLFIVQLPLLSDQLGFSVSSLS